jgi:hypothetical protein
VIRLGLGNLCDADLNNNGMVALDDFNIFRSVYSGEEGDPTLYASADFDSDGDVNLVDFNTFHKTGAFWHEASAGSPNA